MVGFDESRKMGEHATSGASSNFRNTVYAMKRLVGLSFDDPRAKLEMQHVAGVSFVPVPHPSGGPPSIGVSITLHNEDRVVSIEHVYGMMVKHLGQIAAQKAASATTNDALKKSPDQLFPQDWVLAIPNYYTDAQRRAVLSGCDMVGISGVQRLMHENTATALAYGIFKDVKKEFNADKPTHVLFVDMGASAYTVSVVSFVPGKLIVKSACCDPDLGGRDFDLAIAKWVATEFETKYKGKLSGKPLEQPKPRLKLLTACEKAKKTLSPQGVNQVQINVEMLLDDYDFQITLQAKQYEQLCEPLLKRLQGPIDRALTEAGLTVKDLAAVEIVGGSTRIGCVKRQLQSILPGCTLSTTMNADEAVARGAALQSAILSPRFKVLPYEIQEAQPYPIKVSWQDDSHASGMEVDGSSDVTPTDSVVMFERGLNFPIIRRVTLRRAGEFDVKVSYDDTTVTGAASGADLPPSSATDVCAFRIQCPNEERKVRVNVKQDIHGIIHLSSAQMVEEIDDEAPATGESGGGDANKEGGDDAEKKKKIKKTNLEFTTMRPLEWTRDEINKAHEAEAAMANNDRIVQETADKRNELESYIYDMRDKIASNSQLGQYGTEAEKAAFNAKNEEMENWLYGDGFEATKSVYAEKLGELKKLGSPLEARYSEAQNRPAAIQSLQATLEKYRTWLNEAQADDKYAHITDEEREKVRSLVDTTSSWMYDLLDKQGSLGLNVDPAFTVASIKTKNLEVSTVCSPIANKPVPKKPKEEPKKPDPSPSTADAPSSSANGAEDPMDVDKSSENGDTKMDVDA